MISLISGIIILITGFIAPYMSHGKLPGIFFFWTGLYLILGAKEIFLWKPATANWARRGLLCHVTGVSLLISLSGIIFFSETLSHNLIVGSLFQIGGLLASPADKMVNFLSPLASTIAPDGSVKTETGIFRSSLCSLLNISIYIIAGGLTGHMIQKKMKGLNQDEIEGKLHRYLFITIGFIHIIIAVFSFFSLLLFFSGFSGTLVINKLITAMILFILLMSSGLGIIRLNKRLYFSTFYVYPIFISRRLDYVYENLSANIIGEKAEELSRVIWGYSLHQITLAALLALVLSFLMSNTILSKYQIISKKQVIKHVFAGFTLYLFFFSL